MSKSFEIYAPFSPERSASLVAVKSPTHGYSVSLQQFLQAKRKLGIPSWAIVYLRFNGVDKQLSVISCDSVEIVTCVS